MIETIGYIAIAILLGGLGIYLEIESRKENGESAFF